MIVALKVNPTYVSGELVIWRPFWMSDGMMLAILNPRIVLMSQTQFELNSSY